MTDNQTQQQQQFTFSQQLTSFDDFQMELEFARLQSQLDNARFEHELTVDREKWQNEKQQWESEKQKLHHHFDLEKEKWCADLGPCNWKWNDSDTRIIS